MLKVNKTLTKLDLSDNEIGAQGSVLQGTDKATPEGPAALADGLKSNSTVTELNASNNSLRAAGAKAIGEMLKTNKTLTLLDLSENEIGAVRRSQDRDGCPPWTYDPTPEGPASLADGLMKNQAVQQLDVSANILCADGGKTFAASIAENSSITSVCLAR